MNETSKNRARSKSKIGGKFKIYSQCASVFDFHILDEFPLECSQTPANEKLKNRPIFRNGVNSYLR